MLQGITFDKQKMKSEDMAHITNMFFQGKEGVTKGCNISTDSNGDIVVSEGYFSVQGRLVKNVGNTIVEVPTVQSGVLYSILVFEIDLSQENGLELFNQGAFKIISNATTYPTLTKQDLENGGTIYQMEFCRFQNTASGITNLSDTRNVFDLSMYALGSDFQTLASNNVQEAGSNANGQYIKFANGFIMQWGFRYFDSKTVTGGGGLGDILPHAITSAVHVSHSFQRLEDPDCRIHFSQYVPAVGHIEMITNRANATLLRVAYSFFVTGWWK